MDVRIDKWLWAVRIYKSRSLASAACSAGKVRIGGAPLKPQEIAQIRAMTPEQRAQMASALSRRGPVASYLLKLFIMYTGITRRWK